MNNPAEPRKTTWLLLGLQRNGPVASVLATALLPVDAELRMLPARAPADGDDLSTWVDSVAVALLDLDDPVMSAWHVALRAVAPQLPILALYEQADLADLLAMSQLGLDGVLSPPLQEDELRSTLLRFLPLRSAQEPAEQPAEAKSRRRAWLPAAFFSPASEQAQEILDTLNSHANAERWAFYGPAGSEFSLLAQEVGHVIGLTPEEIHFGPGKPVGRPAMVVTRNREIFERSTGRVSILILDAKAAPPESSVGLTIPPLRQRPADIAHYVRAWLPRFSAAQRAPRLSLPLPEQFRFALLAHDWPGNFQELWATLHQLAAAAGDAALPKQLPNSELILPGFEALLAATGPRAFEEMLLAEVEPELAQRLLPALGCPERAPLHA